MKFVKKNPFWRILAPNLKELKKLCLEIHVSGIVIEKEKTIIELQLKHFTDHLNENPQ